MYVQISSVNKVIIEIQLLKTSNKWHIIEDYYDEYESFEYFTVEKSTFNDACRDCEGNHRIGHVKWDTSSYISLMYVCAFMCVVYVQLIFQNRRNPQSGNE